MVRFEWGETKNQSNLVNHGIDFQTAQLIFDDPNCVMFIEGSKDGPRLASLKGLILLATAELVRIISARQATRHERKLYEAAHS